MLKQKLLLSRYEASRQVDTTVQQAGAKPVSQTMPEIVS